MNLLRRDDVTPKCPHCEADLTELCYKPKGPGFLFSKTVVYFCPVCKKVLGVGRSNIG